MASTLISIKSDNINIKLELKMCPIQSLCSIYLICMQLIMLYIIFLVKRLLQ